MEYKSKPAAAQDKFTSQITGKAEGIYKVSLKCTDYYLVQKIFLLAGGNRENAGSDAALPVRKKK